MNEPATTTNEPLPVTVIGGYLGAGKTTLVNHLLRNADGLRIAVLVNEFGTLPIDADLIEAQDENVIAIAGGCVCCSYGNDLIMAMIELAEMEPRPERVLLEASGVALPGAIAASVGLLQHYRLDGVIVMADAETVCGLADDIYMGDTITRQLQDADLIVVNKVDLISESRRSQIDVWFQERFPDAKQVAAERAFLPLEIVFDSIAPKQPRPHHHSSNHGDLFETMTFGVTDPVNPHRLAEELVADDLGIIRAKGFVRTAKSDNCEIQLVGKRTSVALAEPSESLGLVCIGIASQLNRALISRAVARAATRDV
ncbi:MAG: CobW family GTP-binding protein [Hyphomicrobiaceae bacterium]